MTKGETFKFYNYKLTVLDDKEIHYFKNAYCCYEFLDISKQSFHAILKGRKLKKIPFEFELQRIHIRIGVGQGYKWDPDITDEQAAIFFDNPDDDPNYQVILWELDNYDPDYLPEYILE